MQIRLLAIEAFNSMRSLPIPNDTLSACPMDTRETEAICRRSMQLHERVKVILLDTALLYRVYTLSGGIYCPNSI